MARGQSIPTDKQGKAIITLRSSIKSYFKCSYKDINQDQFTEALSIASRIAIESEFIRKAEYPTKEQITVTIPSRGRWFISLENKVNVMSMDNYNLINTGLMEKLRRDYHYQAKLLANLSSRLRIVHGDVSPAILNTPLSQIEF